MLWLWLILRFAMLPVIPVTMLNCAFALVNLWMVVFFGSPPGDPIYVDELAQPVGVSLVQLTVSASLCAGAFSIRRFALRKLRS